MSIPPKNQIWNTSIKSFAEMQNMNKRYEPESQKGVEKIDSNSWITNLEHYGQCYSAAVACNCYIINDIPIFCVQM